MQRQPRGVDRPPRGGEDGGHSVPTNSRGLRCRRNNSELGKPRGWVARRTARIDQVQRVVARVGELEDVSALLDALPGAELERGVDRLQVALAVVRRLEELGTPDANRALIGQMEDEDKLVRSEAVASVGCSGDEGAVAHLVDALDDGDRTVRLVAIGWIGNRRYSPAKPKLVEMLETTHGVERLQVAHALAAIGDPDVEPALRRARRSEWRPWTRFSIPRRVSGEH
jgi:HEAT repeat protein